MASKTITFRIFLHDNLVETRSFTQDVIKLGRLTSSHLRIDDDAVGRMHAVIELGQDGNARLVDLGSAHGTRLNGAAIDRSAPLHSGDRMEFGAYRLEVAIADAAPAQAPVLAQAPVVAPAAPMTARPGAPVARQPQPQLAVDLSKVEDPNVQVAEVVASFGRSVLDVAHVGQARSRKRSALPLLAFGGALLGGGLGLFAYEVSQPWEAYNLAVIEAQQHHAEAPQAPGLGTGSLGMVLALLGLVPMLAGGLRLRDESLEAYTIGEGTAANFKVSGAMLPDPAASPLVERMGDGFALAFTPAMDGAIEVGEHQISLADLVASGRATARDGAYVYPLPAHARARVEFGEVRFNVNLVNRGSVVAGRGETDWAFWGYFGGTATIATAFYMLMRSMPDDALALQLEDDAAAARYAAYFHQADEQVEVEVEPEKLDQVASAEPAGGKPGSRAPGREGEMGKPTAKSNDGAYQLRGPKDADPRLARDFDPSRSARDAGILGILARQDSSFLASAEGGAFSVGNDDADIWGNVTGSQIGEAYGTGGMGLAGMGHGGGGNAGGLIGIGNAGLMGHGTGTNGLSYGPGNGNGSTTKLGPRKPKAPQVIVAKGDIKGDIDKDLIRRIVRSHINEVRGCYNAGLNSNPNLEGRVTIQFSIVGNGKVTSSVVQENTTKDPSVANCIAKAVKRWSFPRVNNGGTALVSYPFRLTAH